MKIFISILLMLQFLSSVAFADSIELTAIQKEDLFNLGIMVGDGNGELRLDDTLTRAEAAKMLCVAADLSFDASKEKSIEFHDVSQTHWAYGYICAAAENGIIQGDGNGNFLPDNNITNEEIAKIIVSLLGYEPMAEARGGYPAGYTAVSTQIGITKDMNLQPKAQAVRNDAAIMIYNALDVPLMTLNEYAAESKGAEYVLLDGNNGNEYLTLRSKKAKK